jgi:PAS domain S-box-containing protein
MKYRNHIIAILALIFLSGFLSVDALGKMQEELLEKQIVVKGDHYYPPFEFINENGEPDGFNVDLFRLMADGLGLNYTIELGPWQQVLHEMETSQADVLMGLMISEQRAENMLFGLPHSVMTHGIFTPEGSVIDVLDDLAGKSVIVQNRDRMHEYLIETGLAGEIIPVDSQLEALQLLEAGHYDAALLGNFQGLHLIRKHQIKNVILSTSKIAPIDYAMAVSPGNEKLLSALNLSLFNLKMSGDYDRLYTKWFGVYDKHFMRRKMLPYYLGAAGLIVLLLLFVFLLRFRVKTVTRNLKKSEEKYRLLVENQTDLVVKVDAAGRFLFVSQSYCKMFGQSEKELLGNTFMPLVHEDDRQATAMVMENLKSPPHYVEIEQRAKTVNGWRWLSWSDTAILGNHGKVKEIIGVGRDITDKKAAENTLVEKNNFIQTVLDNLPIGIALNRINEGDAFYQNKKFEEIYGWDAQTLNNIQAFFESVYPDETYRQQLILQIMGDIDSGDPDRMKWENSTITQQDGSKRVVNAANIPLYDQNTMVSTVMDITKQKRAEQIQKILFKISDAVGLKSSLEDVIAVIRKELGTLMDCRNLYVAFYDKDTDKLFTKYQHNDVDDTSEWQAEGSLTGLVVKQKKSLLVNQQSFQELENQGLVRLLGKPSKAWLGVPLFTQDTVIGALVVQSYDNPQAYAQEDVEMMEFVSGQISLVLQKQKNLEDLLAAKLKAEESDRLKTSFLNNLSHEVRTPLNGIVGCADLLCSSENIADEWGLYSDIIAKNSKHLTNIINDVICMSSIETGQERLNAHVFNINQMLANLQDEFTVLKPEHIELSYEVLLPEENTVINADEEKIKQVLVNLIDNALKFTEKGSVLFGCRIIEDKIHFYVKDTGIGVEEKMQEFIFEKFRKLEQDEQKLYRGTGLGLSIAKAYVEMMDGEIGLESETGKGSTFFFNLPLSTKNFESIKTQNEMETNKSDSKQLTVLIVEDEESNMIYLKSIFRKKDVKLLQAYNGEEAIALYKQNPNIDLVLMDLKMNVMNGFDATKRLKQMNPSLPIIAVTAYAMPVDKTKAFDVGCDDYITKPFRKDALVEIMEKFVTLS